ncbi:hydroxymethylpyrimidine/phosphomethylpyrimidine kinase [Mesorhizobium sp. M1148]|uniref:bifunctional hydroxymethylpyrimidine kinase/phosphomethylpyrimidine kinase n=1 Tax=unclassified Mesorhizobium TaxID=325217 RepID=UPI0009E016CD|nr:MULTISPECIES: bifunctional hydroxymethylpyrimidine kinase/phosphomethylpyrimidine kinase [unclassified Mesorhizobium]WJI44733.1 hydroxymethylpyrimidine/phosphomethylpyrimidine kinase [Mesorhizobium sp. C120A]
MHRKTEQWRWGENRICSLLSGQIPAVGLELPARSRRSLALTCAPAFAVSALTVQTQEDALEIQVTQPGLVTGQMRVALQANRVAGTKVGMLATAEIISLRLQAVLREYRAHIDSPDPVLASTSGRALLEASAIPHHEVASDAALPCRHPMSLNWRFLPAQCYR